MIVCHLIVSICCWGSLKLQWLETVFCRWFICLVFSPHNNTLDCTVRYLTFLMPWWNTIQCIKIYLEKLILYFDGFHCIIITSFSKNRIQSVKRQTLADEGQTIRSWCFSGCLKLRFIVRIWLIWKFWILDFWHIFPHLFTCKRKA